MGQKDDGPEALAVGELDIQHPAVSIDQREGVKLARVAGLVLLCHKT